VAFLSVLCLVCSGTDLRGNPGSTALQLDVPPHQLRSDSESAPFFDAFWMGYWGSVASVVFLIACLSQNVNTQLDKATNDIQAQNQDNGDSDDEGDEGETEELPRNMWALILVSGLGQAKFETNEKPISMWLAVLVSLFMGTVQLTALFLMIHDLDPKADPYTLKPSTPFGSPWTVNSMKVIMTLFMVIALVSEAGQCNNVFSMGMNVKADKFRCVPLVMELFQYVIAISVTWSGVAVILSFQSVPDIIYSSMSIMCISGVDEMFFECFDAVFGLDASFKIQNSDLDKNYVKPFWLCGLMKFLLAFPMLLGVFVLARAWHTETMPTDRVRSLLEAFVSHFI